MATFKKNMPETDMSETTETTVPEQSIDKPKHNKTQMESQV